MKNLQIVDDEKIMTNNINNEILRKYSKHKHPSFSVKDLHKTN